MAFQVACAQLAPEKGAVAKNLDKIAETIVQANVESVELLVFPESATSGYFLEGGVLESSLSQEQLLSELSSRLQGRLTAPIDVLVGFYENAEGTLFNSAAYLELHPEGGTIIGTHRKLFLPTYGLFDEERFVTRGSNLTVLHTRLGRMAILICEDLWHSILPTLCALGGAQAILVPSASPGRGFSEAQIRNLDRFERLAVAVSEEHGVFTMNCQLCGFEGGKGFVGGSRIVSPIGEILAASPIMEEHLLIASMDLDLIDIARSQMPLLPDLQSAWDDLQRIIQGIRP